MHTYKLRGMAITLSMRTTITTTISPGSLAFIGAHQHGICIVVAAIFDFITEEEWGERVRLRVGGGGRNNQQSAAKLYRHCP